MATIGDQVHFWSGGSCHPAEIKTPAPLPGDIHLLDKRSENSWHPAAH
jgi:hypothetical protein